jgi:DNA-binding response OmpR family regulator
MKRVLVVEDSEPIRVLLATVLGEEGYTVETVADGETALARAAGSAYALILTDMTLPGISGVEVIQRLRALELHRTTPVLVITAVTKAAQLRSGRNAGADAWILKPFKSDHVVKTVRGLLASRGSFAESAQDP